MVLQSDTILGGGFKGGLLGGEPRGNLSFVYIMGLFLGFVGMILDGESLVFTHHHLCHPIFRVFPSGGFARFLRQQSL